jgi:PQQ-like domain
VTILPNFISNTVASLVLATVLFSCAKPAPVSKPYSTLPIYWQQPGNVYGGYAISNDVLFGWSSFFSDPTLNSVELSVIDLKTKAIKAKHVFPGSSDGPGDIITDDSLAYVSVENNGVYILNLQGEILSHLELGRGNISVAGFSFQKKKNFLFLPYQDQTNPNDGTLSIYDVSVPTTPTLINKIKLPRWINSFDVSDDGETIYLDYAVKKDSNANDVLALRSRNGNQIWSGLSVAAGSQTYGRTRAVRLAGNRLIGVDEVRMWSLDPLTGTRLWEQPLHACDKDGAAGTSRIELAEGKIFLNQERGSCMDAYNLNDGKHLWTVNSINPNYPDAGATFFSSVRYRQGKIYAFNGSLWIIKADTGEVLKVEQSLEPATALPGFWGDRLVIWARNLTVFEAMP